MAAGSRAVRERAGLSAKRCQQRCELKARCARSPAPVHYRLSSALNPPPSVFRHPRSDSSPRPSILRPQSSALSLPPSVLSLESSALVPSSSLFQEFPQGNSLSHVSVSIEGVFDDRRIQARARSLTENRSMSNQYHNAQGSAPAICYSSQIPPDLGPIPPGGPVQLQPRAPMVSVSNPFQPCGPTTCPVTPCCGGGTGGEPINSLGPTAR